MEKFDVVIVDSGVDKSHSIFKGKAIYGRSVKFDPENTVFISDDFYDDIGHGTAVYYLISRYIQDEKVLNMKVFSMDFQPDTFKIIAVLEYIYKNIECKIIHLSNGIVYCDDISELHKICNKIIQKGTIIVAAFENTGILSYPAVFKDVIGVDWSIECTKIQDFEVVEGNQIDIRGIGSVQRLPWKQEEYKYVSGSSFVAPHVTGLILKQIRNGGLKLNKKHIMDYFKTMAKRIYPCEREAAESCFFPIKQAVVFPYNKETDALIRYRDMLEFDVLDIFDLPIRGNIGKKIESYADTCKEKEIKNYNEIDWSSDFETFILGHCKRLSRMINFDFIKDSLEKCIKYKKNIVSFDSLRDYHEECDRLKKIGRNVYFPEICGGNIPQNRFGKLYCIGKPVLMVSGTGSQQGKFSLQLKLRNRFKQEGYVVGQLGTEPSSLLFGMDEVFSCGYGSKVELTDEQIIGIVNLLMHNIEEKNPDIILTGTQSHILQNNMGNLAFFPLINYAMMLAIDPDAIILCINYEDSIDYIERCISFLQSFVESTVLGLVLFPIKKEREWKIISMNSERLTEKELKNYANKLQKQIDIPVYLLENKSHMECLYQRCVDFWSE